MSFSIDSPLAPTRVNGWKYNLSEDSWELLDRGVVVHSFSGRAVRAEEKRSGKTAYWALAWLFDKRSRPE